MSIPATETKRTIDLWPTAGKMLGLGKNLCYQAAARGEIPGVFQIGHKWLVAREPFERFLAEGKKGK
jgi:hypothetical protein